MACYEAPPDPSIDLAADDLERLLDRLDASLASLGFALSADPAALRDKPLASLAELLSELEAALHSIDSVCAEVEGTGAVPSEDLGRLLQVTEERERIDALERALTGEEPVLARALHDAYAGFNSDWAGLLNALAWSREVRSQYGDRYLPQGVADAIASGEASALDWDGHQRSVGELEAAAEQCAALFDETRRSEIRATILGPAGSAQTFVDDLVRRLDDPATWQSLAATRASLVALGWGSFVDTAAPRRIPREDLEPASRRAWLEAWFASLRTSEPRLGGFTQEEHERVIKAYREVDRQLVHLGRERVLRAYGERKPAPVAMSAGEQAIVRREAIKRRKHWPVRRLLGEIPTLLPLLKPCLMMSPLSVSHFLTPEARFDLVVFDEASQVPPEDAVNCIYRGRQLIVAGDQNQLPPTDFFQLAATTELDAEIDDELGDFESVLDVCRSLNLPSVPLQWHYRSRHDALIAFSNHYIYRDSLVTFPAPIEHSDALGVKFVHVPDAVFERGRTASNPIEAQRVMDVVEEIARNEPSLTLGVVAFSVARQQAIQDELARRLRVAPELERRLGDGRLDGFFIKNLETVQGDERDVIVFSVGYGRDENGRVYHNFGPLNRKGGARRLNVAVSRARRRVIVVSSIRAADLKLEDPDPRSPELPEGARLLRAYLRYAETGQLEGATDARARDELGSLEDDVAGVIEGLGFEVVRRVGTSSYRVDVGVLSKLVPGRICLGVECDGPVYENAKTARDRDRLRREVLGRLGWRLHRIWAQDWYFRRAANIDRLRAAIDAAERELATSGGRLDTGATERPAGTRPEGNGRTRTRIAGVELNDSLDAGQLPWTRPYQLAKVTPYQRGWMQFHEPVLLNDHVQRVVEVTRAEGPIHERLVVTRLMHAFGLARAGNRITYAVERALVVANGANLITRRGPFVWPTEMTAVDCVRVPVPTQDETRRVIEVIPPEEMDLALLRITESAGTIPEAELKVTVARVLGFDRTGGNIDDALQVRLETLLRSQQLRRAGTGAVALGEKANLTRLVAPEERLRVGGWARHPTLGVGRVLEISGSLVTLEIGGRQRQIETSVMPLKPAPPPAS